MQASQKLISYIPYFEQLATDDSKTPTTGGSLLYMEYEPAINEFIDDFYQTDLVDTDYTATLHEHGIQSSEEMGKALPGADLSLLKAIMTQMIREERFVAGAIASYSKKGYFLQALQRLADLLGDTEYSKAKKTLLDADYLMERVVPLSGDPADPYLRPFVLAADRHQAHDAFLIGINPATSINQECVPVKEYAAMLLDETEFEKTYEKLRKGMGKTGVSKTRSGASQLAGRLEAETGVPVLRTNVATYPTQRADGLKGIPQEEIVRSERLFFDLLEEHKPRTLLVYGSDALERLAKLLQETGLIGKAPSAGVRDIEKSASPCLHFTYANGKEASVFACRHLMYFGSGGKTFEPFVQAVIQHINREETALLASLFLLTIDASEYTLSLVNRSNDNAKRIRIHVNGHMSEEGDVFTMDYEKCVETLKANETLAVETLTSVDLDYMTEYNVTFTKDGKWFWMQFENRKLRNAETLETEAGRKAWQIPCSAAGSASGSSLLSVLFKDGYEIEPSGKGSYFAKMIEEKPFTEQALRELYRLADFYYRGEGRNDSRIWGMADFLQENHGVRFEQSEGTEILLAYCMAGLDFFGLTEQEMARIFMKCAL